MALMFFDYDGVMVDSLSPETAYYVEACQAFGIDAVKDEKDMAKLSEGNFYEEMANRGVTQEDIKKVTEYYGRIKSDGRHPIRAFDDIMDLLSRVSMVIPTYIVTSNTSKTVEDRLAEYHISTVKGVMGADKEPSKKKKLTSVMSMYPGEKTLFVGDTKGDMVESADVGIDVRIGVTWGWQSADVVLSGDPDYWFDERDGLRRWFDGFLTAIQ